MVAHGWAVAMDRERSAAMVEPSPHAASPLAGSTRPALRVALFAGWLVVVACLAAGHVFWRDEVRAFSLALAGDDVVAMARAVHGEGHPLLWYLLLRAAHVLAPVREVLPAVGLAVGIAGAGFFAWRAPFRPLVIAAVLLSGWMAFEYSVMARNYGVSMLLMFVLADRFARRRDGAMATGALLFLLCNTNVPSVILAGGFLLFRLIEIVADTGWRWSPPLGRWLGAAALCLTGALACFLTVYPPFNEAAVSPLAAHLSPATVLAALVNVAQPLQYLWPEPAWGMPGAVPLLTLLVLSMPVSLLRSPAGFIAAAIVLPLLLLFFQFAYPGSYRHQALYLCFLLSLHWMTARGRGGRWGSGLSLPHGPLPQVAAWLVIALLSIQGVATASLLVQTAGGRVMGQSAALGRQLAQPALARAIVIGTPDVMVEALPYYAANPTYLLRQQRFGTVAHFTHHAERHLTLGGILATARRLQAATHRPIVILLQQPLPRDAGARFWDEGMLGDTTVRPGEAAAFRAATTLIARPVPLIRYGFVDESYDVYVLKAPVTGS